MAITPLMPVYPRSPVRPVRGEGAYLYGERGEKYLDFAAGIAVGALLALMLIALYVRFTPGFNRQKRLEEREDRLSLPAGVAASSLTTIEASLGLLKIIAGGRCARSAHRPTIATLHGRGRAVGHRSPAMTNDLPDEEGQ